MKKVVLKVSVHDNKGKQKAMKAVSTILGINSITMDMKEKKMTVIGEVDPMCVVSKLRKSWHTEIDSIGPSKEPEKKETTTISEIVNAYPPYYVVETVAEENYPNACCVIS